MVEKVKKIIVVCALSLIPTFLVWTPFALKLPSFWNIPLPTKGMATIVANYDGPLYLVVSKSLYNKEIIKGLTNFPLSTEYYAAHLPLYPLLIRTFSYLLGYPYAMLFVTLLSSILAIFFFQKLISRYLSNRNILWATALFSLFPARWLIVRSVGSAEPLFTASIIASIYYFQQKKYLKAGIWGALAQMTKSPAILLFISYLGFIIFKEVRKLALKEIGKVKTSTNLFRYFPIILIPLALLGVFTFYKIQTGDFLAYFHSGDNIHLFFPPFQIFNYAAPWVGTFWLEEITFIYLIGALGLIKLIQKKEWVMAWFTGVFFASTLFVAHRDLMRYFLPVVPFLYVAFSDLITKKEFKIAFLVIIIPIYLFSLAFISQNAMPIANWGPLL